MMMFLSSVPHTISISNVIVQYKERQEAKAERHEARELYIIQLMPASPQNLSFPAQAHVPIP